MTYWATAWTLGSEAAGGLPLAALSGPAIRAPWGWQAAALARSLASVEPSIARDGEVIELVDGGPEALVAAAIGGVGAGFRLLAARLGDGDDEAFGSVELLPPGAVMPPGPRTRANVALEPLTGRSGDPDIVPGTGLFGAPERFDRRPFSAADVRNTVVEVAVESLKARGEPASADRLLGEVLVGLDRAGQLRRLVTDRDLAAPDNRGDSEADQASDPGRAEPGHADPGTTRDSRVDRTSDRPSGSGSAPPAPASGSPSRTGDAIPDSVRSVSRTATDAAAGEVPPDGPSIAGRRPARPADAPPDQVEALLALIADGMFRW